MSARRTPLLAPPPRRTGRRARWGAAVCALAAASGAAPGRADEIAGTVTLAPVQVVGTTSLPGLGTPLNQVPGNVQTLQRNDADSRRALNLSDALNRSAGSVNLNDTAGNPFQPDVNFRGFTASPALGTPQGLSVFVDGVRFNEVFGDTVNWDLIPESAIAKITVMPGSNPVFGLNTLGGALNVTTKSGTTDPGTFVQASGGSFGRTALQFETGARAQSLDYFVTGSAMRESGWAQHNPSQVRQLFGKTGYHGAAWDLELSATLAHSFLEGNQSLPLSLLSQPSQAYTWPDYQTNQMAFFNARATGRLSPTLLLEADLYFRQVDTFVFNSNVNNGFDPTVGVGPGNEPTGNALEHINQFRPGATLQLSSTTDWWQHRNHLILGVNLEDGRTEFSQYAQPAGTSRDTSSSAPVTLATSLNSVASEAGVYASDNFAIDARTFLTLSARYNDARAQLRDQLGTALNGDHAFRRVNPAAGITYNPSTALTSYASFSQGMRVPTPVELTCANPSAPCSLPNAFSSDPALKPVLSDTIEFGGRGRWDATSQWSAALFRTTLNNDIQFISSGGGATSAGYFQNVGQTRRQGLELGAGQHFDALSLSVNYTYLDARFETPLVLNSPSNSSAAALSCGNCTDIVVRPGDRIPGMPHQILKLRAGYDVDERAALGANLLVQSSQYARGDENNLDVHGAVPGFALVNLDATLRLARGWQAFLKVDNVFDRRYSTFGALGQNVFTAPGNTFDATGASWRNEQFRSVGSPRGAWIGLSYNFGATAADGG